MVFANQNNFYDNVILLQVLSIYFKCKTISSLLHLDLQRILKNETGVLKMQFYSQHHLVEKVLRE